MTLSFVSEPGPLGEPCLKATYADTSGPYPVLVRSVGNLDLSSAKRLMFDIASENEATIVIAVEMKQGGRFHFEISPRGDRKVFHADISLNDFEAEGEGGPERFDPALWKTITLADISGGNTGNTFWLGNLRVKRSKSPGSCEKTYLEGVGRAIEPAAALWAALFFSRPHK